MKRYAFGYINNYYGRIPESFKTSAFSELDGLLETEISYIAQSDNYIYIFNGELAKVKRSVVEKPLGREKKFFEELFGLEHVYSYESYPLLGEIIDDNIFEDIITSKKYQITKKNEIKPAQTIGYLTPNIKVFIKEVKPSEMSDRIKNLSEKDLNNYISILNKVEKLIKANYYEAEMKKKEILMKKRMQEELDKQKNIEGELFIELFKKSRKK